MLSGNRNFEARVHPQVRANYLASPLLVVAFALAGRMDIDLSSEPLGTGKDGRAGVPARHLAHADGGPGRDGRRRSSRSCSRNRYGAVFDGDETWQALDGPRGAAVTPGTRKSTYVQEPPFFMDLPPEPGAARGTSAAPGCWRVLGDSVTTDHISPAGSIPKDGPAGTLPDGARRRARWTGTPSAPGAATTK